MTIARPHLHFTPPQSWMNDPNGLVYHKNVWHLFYQAQPAGESEKRWGHAKSSDLVTWHNLPDALLPDALGAIWSGSAVCDADNTSGFFANNEGSGLVAIFTHRKLHTNGPQTQSQSLAYSHDDGQTWTKYEQNPVLEHASSDFRDPKVFWHTPTSAWVMIVSAGIEVEIYRSPDLENWTVVSKWGANILPGVVWECPDLFSLFDENGGEKWILLSSFLDMNNFKGQMASCYAAYFSGSFDGYTFAAQENPPLVRRVDFGPDNYAPVTFAHAPDGRRVLVGWLNHWGYAGSLDTQQTWQGQMTVPRELAWKNNALYQSLPPEGEAARFWPRVVLREPVTVDPAREPVELFVPPQMNGAAWRMEARQNNVPLWSFFYNANDGVWEFSRGEASMPPLKPGAKPTTAEFWTQTHSAPVRNANAAVHLLFGACSVEVFCDSGETVFSFQVFPALSGPCEIQLRVGDGD